MTPRILLEDDEVDIFAEVLEDATYENKELMAKALWARWRDYCIGSCDLDGWVQGMKDRLTLIGDKWDAIMSKALVTELNSITDRSYERIVQRTAMPDTDGDVRVISHKGSDTTEISHEGSDTTEISHKGDDVNVMEHETLPQTESGATKYLDARQTDTHTNGMVDTTEFTPGVKDTTEYTPGVTDTETYRPNTQDKETYHADDTIPAATFNEMMRNYPSVLMGFADEFSGYFINRWY